MLLLRNRKVMWSLSADQEVHVMIAVMTAGVTVAMTEEVHVTTAEVTAAMTAVAREMTAEAESLSRLSLLTKM